MFPDAREPFLMTEGWPGIPPMPAMIYVGFLEAGDTPGCGLTRPRWCEQCLDTQAQSERVSVKDA